MGVIHYDFEQQRKVGCDLAFDLRRGWPRTKRDAGRPDTLVPQEVFDVRAVSTADVGLGVHPPPSKPWVRSVTAADLMDVLKGLRRVGAATDRDAEDRELVSSLRQRIAKGGQ